MRQIKAIITGKVQGVYFRQSTKQVAQQYNIVGHAINLADTSVEVIAIGHEPDIALLIELLHIGPKSAVVSSVTITDYLGPMLQDFTTG
ncbi:MAG: acylphosphatase [Gammaproteobacteria bacterium]|nr:acylphosphatase [Gammaproteobacteria bacterium]